MGIDIIWAENQPPAPRCNHPKRSYQLIRCGGGWSELRGENEKVGWMWICADGDCPSAIRAGAHSSVG